MRNKKEIDIEIQKLEKMKPRVRQFTVFGDDNHKAIDAQIKVLRHGKTEREVYEEYEDVASEAVLESAAFAAKWAEGKEDEAPSKDWAPLIERKTK